VPQVKATTVADTPEARRLAENTRIQSQVNYHADFEKSKGRLTQVADDPETQRIRNNSKIISNAAYHGDLEKKKQMEQLRVKLDEGSSSHPQLCLQFSCPKTIAENIFDINFSFVFIRSNQSLSFSQFLFYRWSSLEKMAKW
jgi:hypothetical protein